MPEILSTSSDSLSGKSIVLYFPLLRGGGAERLYLNLAPYFVDAGMHVTLLLDRSDGALMDAIPPRVSLDVLHAPRLLKAFPRLISYIRRKKPDLLFSSISLNNMALLGANVLANANVPIIVSQHDTLTQEIRYGGVYRALPLLNRLLLRYADAVVAVSAGVAQDLCHVTRRSLEDFEIIPNGVVTSDFDELAAQPCEHKWLKQKNRPVFLGVGRLTPQKDFQTMLRGFAELRKRRDARLIILGEGVLKDELLSLAISLNVQDEVDLPGYLSNPLPYMKAADALVLSSVHEGFGLVLAEALACGTPVISTDCKFGPAEILDYGRFGDLVPIGDWRALADAMIRAVEAPRPRDVLRGRGQAFSVADCAQKYLALFDRVISRDSAG